MRVWRRPGMPDASTRATTEGRASDLVGSTRLSTRLNDLASWTEVWVALTTRRT